ncbi:MAG: peptidylprolyl isomerase [Candidatus Krumholzibacteria bacterium]|nr:peptidylprolyl isomerase [Candidatus Krumholzibacteria bacterium]
MHQWKTLSACVICAAAVCFASIPGPRAAAPAGASDSTAGSRIIDRVVATVEDQAIMQSDVENEVRRYLMQAQKTSLPADQEKEIRQEVLNSLVADALLAIQAERENVKIEDKEVDAAVEKAIDDNRTALGGDDAFMQQLAAEGLTLEGLRAIYADKLRGRMLIERFMYQKILPGVRVTEADVQDYYREHLTELPQRPATVTIAHILIVPKPSAAVLAKALERITAIESELKAGGDFAELAKKYSDCPSAKFGGSLGTINLADLNNPPFEEAARALAIGQVSRPVLTEFGYHLIKVEGIEGDKVALRHILVRAEATPEDSAAAAELAERVRGELVAGADFSEEAAKYSGDYATKNAGGLIGEIPLESLPDAFKDAIKGVPAGGIAPVVKETRGFRIVKIMNWNEGRVYSYDEAKDELQKLIEQQKLQERLATYIDELKKDYSVVIKGE